MPAQALRLTALVIQLHLALAADVVPKQKEDVQDTRDSNDRFPGCRWSLNCTQLCEVHGECLQAWQEEANSCVLSFPTSEIPSDWVHNSGRIVSSNMTYRIHKDVLSDLLHRYNQVKRIRAQGGSTGPPGLGQESLRVMRYGIGLCLPRVILAVQYLWGQSIPAQTLCCHQECHWEDLLRARVLPSLQTLLARSVASRERQQADPDACKFRGGGGLIGGAQGLVGRWQVDAEECGWRLVPWLKRQAARRPTWRGVGYLVGGAVAPALVVAYGAIEDCSDVPLLLLYILCVATLRTACDWYHLFSFATDKYLSVSDRISFYTSTSMLVSVVMALVAGLQSALFSVVEPSFSHILLLGQLAFLSAANVGSVHAARLLHHAYHKSERVWVRAEVRRLRRHMDALHTTATAATARAGGGAAAFAAAAARSPRRQAAAASGGGAAAAPPGGAGLAAAAAARAAAAMDGATAAGAAARAATRAVRAVSNAEEMVDTALLLETLENYLFPGGMGPLQAQAARQAVRATRGSSGGVAAAPAQPRGDGREAAGSQGAGQDAARSPRRSPGGAAAAAGGAGRAGAHSGFMLDLLSGRAGGAGRGRAASDSGVASGSDGTDRADREVINSGAVARAQLAAAAAAQAAAAVVHWPPPLDLPAWLDDHPAIPHAFRCPITLTLMKEPTQASSGVTYERSAIFQWLSLHRKDPVTHVPLKRHRLTPNLNLRHMIEDWAVLQVAGKSSEPQPGS